MIGYETILPGTAFYMYAMQHARAKHSAKDNGLHYRDDAVGVFLSDIAADKRFFAERGQAGPELPRDKREWEQILAPVLDAETRETFNKAWEEADHYAREILRGAKDAPGSLLKQPLNDYGNGQRLVERWGEALKFAEDTGTWFTWDAQRWLKDPRALVARYLAHETMLAFYEQTKTMPDEFDEKGKPQDNQTRNWAISSFKTNAIKNMLTEAAPYLRCTSDEFDKDPWLYNVSNGTLDLRTATLREYKREDKITKISPVTFDRDASCPIYEKFAKETFGDDLLKYVERAVGYSLTGITREKCLFIIHGKTDTGKTTFLESVLAMFGDYATRISVETLMAKTRDSTQQEDIADLFGVRFAVTSETEDGQRMAEALVKRQTQGQGKIKACRKYEHTVQFTETHKLWIDSNHLPMVHGTDDSIWGRIIPIPALHQVKKKDKHLPEKLKKEMSGIFTRFVAGCIEWQRLDSLGESEAITKLRREYREQCDLLGLFLKETTEIDEQKEELTSDLYLAYHLWAKDNGEFVMPARWFGRRLSERDEMTAKYVERQRGWVGRALNSQWVERVRVFKFAQKKDGK